jgi:hypothetical protein
MSSSCWAKAMFSSANVAAISASGSTSANGSPAGCKKAFSTSEKLLVATPEEG